MKISQITSEQEQTLMRFRDEWLSIGLSTQPADWENAERVLARFYNRIGEKPPMFVRCRGLFEAEIAMNLLANLLANLHANLHDNLLDNLLANLLANLHANLHDNLRANLHDNLLANLHANLHDNLLANLRANLHDNLLANLRDNLHANLRANLHDNLRANLRANLLDNLHDNLLDNLHANLRANLHDNLLANLHANLHDNLLANLSANLLAKNLEFYWTWLWGALDSYWIAFYLFPHEHIRVMHTPEQAELLNEWVELAKACFLIWPYRGVCFISDRPSAIHKDAKGRLHCEAGPAVAFRDGWAVWYWHGVSVPQWVIETPEKITPEFINQESNAEVRRVMLERYGWEKMLAEIGAVRIDAHPNPKIGELWRWREPDGIEVQVVRALNGTPDPETGGEKWYAFRVPLDFRRALDASRWSYPLYRHLSDDEYLLTADYRA